MRRKRFSLWLRPTHSVLVLFTWAVSISTNSFDRQRLVDIRQKHTRVLNNISYSIWVVVRVAFSIAAPTVTKTIWKWEISIYFARLLLKLNFEKKNFLFIQLVRMIIMVFFLFWFFGLRRKCIKIVWLCLENCLSDQSEFTETFRPFSNK